MLPTSPRTLTCQWDSLFGLHRLLDLMARSTGLLRHPPFNLTCAAATCHLRNCYATVFFVLRTQFICLLYSIRAHTAPSLVPSMMITDVYVERPNPQLHAFRRARVRVLSGRCVLSGLFFGNLVSLQRFFCNIFRRFSSTEGNTFCAGRPSRSGSSANRSAAAT